MLAWLAVLGPVAVGGPALEPPSVVKELLQLLLALAAVCVLAVVLLRYGVRRLYGRTQGGTPELRLLARLSLEPRRTIYLVAAGRRRFLVGGGDGPFALLAELEPEPAGEEAAQATAANGTIGSSGPSSTASTAGTTGPSGTAGAAVPVRFADVLAEASSPPPREPEAAAPVTAQPDPP